MKHYNYFLLFVVIQVVSGNHIYAQDFSDTVITTNVNQRIAETNDSLITSECLPNAPYKLPVVFWVINRIANDTLVTRVQIDSAMIWLNRDFANTEGFFPSTKISFEIAQRNQNGNATSGINYVDGSVLPAYSQYGVNVITNSTGFSVYEFGSYGFTWNNNHYINVYIVDSIYNRNSGVAVNIPTFFGEGIFIIASEIPKKLHTLSHEMGHYLNLLHTFEGQSTNPYGTCPLNTDCTNNGDKVCDTPPHLSGDYYTTSSCYTGSDLLNSLQSFLSYGAVRNRFTFGQTERMSNYLFSNRSGLIMSDALIPINTIREVAITKIVSDTINQFCNYYMPQVEIKNIGTAIFMRAGIETYIDDSLWSITQISDLNLNRNEFTSIFLNPVFATEGEHTFRCKIVSINGSIDPDFNVINNVTCKSIDMRLQQYNVTASGADVDVSGMGNYVCNDTVHMVALFDTTLYVFEKWTNQNDSFCSNVPIWNFTIKNDINLIAHVKPKITTCIKNPSFQSGIKIYPNPTNSIINIETLSSTFDAMKIKVFDILGNSIIEQDLQNATRINGYSIDMGQYPRGQYFLQIQNSDDVVFSSFILQ